MKFTVSWAFFPTTLVPEVKARTMGTKDRQLTSDTQGREQLALSPLVWWSARQVS